MASRPILFRPEQTQRPPLLPVAFVLAYVVSTALAYALTTDAGGLAVLWINNGVLAAALLLLPRSTGVLVALIAMITDFTAAAMAGSPPGQAALIAMADLTESIIAAILLRRVGGAALDPTVLRRFGLMVLYAILPATLLIGTIGATVSTLAFGNAFQSVWLAWVIGDFLGMLIGTPGVLLLARYCRHNVNSAAGPVERVGLVVLLGLTAVFIFFVATFPSLYIIYPIGLLAVIRLGAPSTMLGILAIAFTAAAATVTGHGPIAAASDQMGQRILVLQFYLATLQASALVLTSVLTQRARAQAGLRRALALARAARRDAEAAAGAKGRFLAVMSHEMRTPLNGIAGHAQILDSRDDLPAQARESVATVRASSEVLLSLINDVLDYSRTEGHQLQLSTAPVSLANAIDGVVEIIRPMISARPIDLVVERDALEGLVHIADERRVSQILLNLLGNAAKFTETGEIALTVTAEPGADGDLVTFSVRDTGIGIAEDSQALLFQPFSQVDASATRSFHGAGLGLAITRSLAELMGGDITVSSRLDEGSEFRVRIPFTRTSATPVTAAPCPEISPGTDGEDDIIRVLVVDDHPVNRQVACLMLEAAGFAVATAENGLQAVDVLRGQAFHLVLMDLHMPVMDGLTACRQIRALDGPASRTPVVAMTAAAMPDDIEQCRAAGMEAHIAKPIRQEELLAAALRAASGGWGRAA